MANFSVLQELVLRKMILGHAHELPRSEYRGYFAEGPTTDLVSDALAKRTRRRLTLDSVGYRSPPDDGSGPGKKVWSHDHAATRGHIRRLMSSEAAAAADSAY